VVHPGVVVQVCNLNTQLKRLRKENPEFKAGLGYIESSRPAWMKERKKEKERKEGRKRCREGGKEKERSREGGKRKEGRKKRKGRREREKERTRDMTQVVEHLPNKHKALSSIPSSTTKKKNDKVRRWPKYSSQFPTFISEYQSTF
jgi:hypothetical protein